MNNATLNPASAQDTQQDAKPKKRMLCRSHPDFHIPAGIVVGEGFDGDALGRQLSEAGADSIAIFAKCHYGHAYYPTEIGTPHPQLQCDLLGEAVKGCNKHGVGVTAYLSVFYDTAAVAKHPEWLLQKVPTDYASSLEPDNYSPTCVNSGYIEEDLIPMSIEVADKYDVDELFYDTMTWFRPCFCNKCQNKFGKEIPADDSHPNWPEFVVWYRKCFDDAFLKITNAVREAHPDVGVIFNWKWGVREPSAAPKGIDHLSSDYWGSGKISSYHSRFYASTGLTYDYMCGRFRHGLGEWDNTTDETLLYTSSAAVANGAGYYIIDRMLPNGTLEPRAYDAMKIVFSHINDRRKYLENTTPVKDIGVISSYNSIIGKNLERFSDFSKRRERMKAVDGIGQLLCEQGLHYTAMSEETAQETINDYRIVFVPEQSVVDQKTVDALRAYAESGGHVVISISGPDLGDQDALCELAGVKMNGYSKIPYTYIGTERPHHVKVPSALFECVDAEVVFFNKEPLPVDNDRAKFGHGLAPYTEENGTPGVTRRRLGKGTITAISSAVFEAYQNLRNQDTEALVLGLIKDVSDNAPIVISTKARVEMSLMRQNNDLIIHLVNHSGKETVGNWVFPVTDYLPDINDIQVNINVGDQQPCISACPSGENIHYTVSNGVAEFTAPTLEAMNTLVVHGYYN